MRQTYDYEDHSGGLPLIYMALAVSVFVLMILVLVVTMNKDKGPSPGYIAAMQEEEAEAEETAQENTDNEETGHQIGGDLVASDLDFWDMYPLETEEEKEIVRRGRNAKSKHQAKNATSADYAHATAFEILIGYLYLSNNPQRLEFILNESIALLSND